MKARKVKEIRKSQERVSNQKLYPGDYVFATKFQDASPFDRWHVGHIKEADSFAVYFEDTGVIPFRYAQRISNEDGRHLIKCTAKH